MNAEMNAGYTTIEALRLLARDDGNDQEMFHSDS